MQREAILGLCCLSFAAGLHPATGQRPNILGKLKVAKRTMPVFGQQIAYYESGRGKTVVLLPNLTWDSHAWSQNLPTMSAKYHIIGARMKAESKRHQIEQRLPVSTPSVR